MFLHWRQSSCSSTCSSKLSKPSVLLCFPNKWKTSLFLWECCSLQVLGSTNPDQTPLLHLFYPIFWDCWRGQDLSASLSFSPNHKSSPFQNKSISSLKDLQFPTHRSLFWLKSDPNLSSFSSFYLSRTVKSIENWRKAIQKVEFNDKVYPNEIYFFADRIEKAKSLLLTFPILFWGWLLDFSGNKFF